MKLRNKVAVVVLVLAVAAFAVRFVYRGGQEDGTRALVGDDVIAELQTLKIRKDDMPIAERDELQDRYAEAVKSLNESYNEYVSGNREQGGLLFWPLLTVADFNQSAGDYEKAIRAYRYLHELQPFSFVPVANLAQLYANTLREYTEAEKHYLEAIRLAKEDAYLETYYNELYQIYRFRFNNEQRAEQLLRDGVAAHPENTNIRAQLALHYYETGQREAAIDQYRRILEIYPESIVAKEFLSKLES